MIRQILQLNYYFQTTIYVTMEIIFLLFIVKSTLWYVNSQDPIDIPPLSENATIDERHDRETLSNDGIIIKLIIQTVSLVSWFYKISFNLDLSNHEIGDLLLGLKIKELFSSNIFYYVIFFDNHDLKVPYFKRILYLLIHETMKHYGASKIFLKIL